MPIFGKSKEFVGEKAFRDNLGRQVAMAPETLAQLRKLGVTDNAQLKLEFFFYTNQDEKARALAAELRQLGYSVEQGPSAHDRKQQVVTGWTEPMQMDEQTVKSWAARMCEIGYNHDCEFDGWGTIPEQ